MMGKGCYVQGKNQIREMNISENQNRAINEIVEMIVSVIGKGSREIDTTEAISSSARLAGSFLFRSFEFNPGNANPGDVMLSEEANTKGPQLVNITHAILHNYGIQIDNNKMSGGNTKPTESNFLDVISKVQNPALEIMKKNDLSYEQMAQSTAIATAFIIQQSQNISPEEGLGIAIYHYIEGTKTNPPKLDHETNFKMNKTEDNKTTKSKPWWKIC